MDPQYADTERRLAMYRPVGPPPGFRNRLTSAARELYDRRRSRSRAYWYATAGMLIVLVYSLDLATSATYRETALLLDSQRYEWTAEAEEAVRLVDAGEELRDYLALQASFGPLVDPSSIDCWEIQ